MKNQMTQKEMESLSGLILLHSQKVSDYTKAVPNVGMAKRHNEWVEMLKKAQSVLRGSPSPLRLGYPVILERTPMKRIPIKMRLLAAETELSELNSLFDLQCRRSAEAHKVWQSDTGEQYRPDLGELLRYFMEQRALLVRLHALLKNGNYASDEYAEVMDSIERKDFCRHNKEVSIAR